MTNTETVQYALLCLEALDAQAPRSTSAQVLSRTTGIPSQECHDLLDRFVAAGLVVCTADGLYLLDRPLSEMTSLDILSAVWAKKNPAPAFQLLYGPAHGMELKRTLEAAGRIGRPVEFAQG